MKSVGTITEDRVLGRFQKSASASIQVTLVNWQSNDYLDIREVVPSCKAGEQFTYTKKGIRINAALVDKLRELLDQVPVAHEEHGEGAGEEAGED